ncbi:hypothetical protein HMI55_005550, partial [Coelomomyces lativittatus]
MYFSLSFLLNQKRGRGKVSTSWMNLLFFTWLMLVTCFDAKKTSLSHTRVQRRLDISTKGSNLVYDKLELDILNQGTKPLERYLFRLPSSFGQLLRFKAYQKDSKVPLKFTQQMDKT